MAAAQQPTDQQCSSDPPVQRANRTISAGGRRSAPSGTASAVTAEPSTARTSRRWTTAINPSQPAPHAACRTTTEEPARRSARTATYPIARTAVHDAYLDAQREPRMSRLRGGRGGMSTPRIYVACLAAYNNGRLHGRWIDADQSVEDIWSRGASDARRLPRAACRGVGHPRLRRLWRVAPERMGIVRARVGDRRRHRRARRRVQRLAVVRQLAGPDRHASLRGRIPGRVGLDARVRRELRRRDGPVRHR